MIKSKKIALIYRCFALIIAITGLLDLLGVFQGEFHHYVLYYYTSQSNIMGIILFTLLLIKTISGIRESSKSNDSISSKNTACYFPRFSMVCSINILLTLVVFWVLLVPQLQGIIPLWTYSNLATHAFTPLLCLIDYILFSEPRRLKYRDVYYVMIFPLCYLIYSSVAGLMGLVYAISEADGLPIRFPYFFFDFDRIGALSFVYITCLLIFFLIIGHIFYYIDKKRKEI